MLERLALNYLEFRKKHFLNKADVVEVDKPIQLIDKYRSTFGRNPRLIDELVAQIYSVDFDDLEPRLIETAQYEAFRENLNAKLTIFENKPYQLGAIDLEIDVVVAILSQLKSADVLEIGVANGYSSAFLYYALSKIDGTITSIDLPRISERALLPKDVIRKWLASRGKIKNTGTLGDLNPGGVIPAEKYAGWLVPMNLRLAIRNTTIYGDAFRVFEDLSFELKKFDVAVLDAMKLYDARIQIMKEITNRLRPGGICIVDGYWVNKAFEDFCAEHGFTTWEVGRIGIFSKSVHYD